MGVIAPSQAAELPSHKSRLTRDTDHGHSDGNFSICVLPEW